MARPTKLTPEIQRTIVAALQRGNYAETAAALAGISKDTFYAWLRRGARTKAGIYAQFSDAVKRAMAHGEARDLQVVDSAAQGGAWQAAAWKLERKFPQRWGRRVIVDDDADAQEKREQVSAIVAKLGTPGAVGELATLTDSMFEASQRVADGEEP